MVSVKMQKKHIKKRFRLAGLGLVHAALNEWLVTRLPGESWYADRYVRYGR